MSYLTDLVKAKIQELGPEASAEFFGVTPRQIGQWANNSKQVSLAAVEKVFDPEKFKVPVAPLSAEWEGRRVAICLPAYKSFHPHMAFCIFSLLDRAKMRLFLLSGDALIAHTRNSLAKQFLDSEAEYSYWQDDDLLVPIGNADWFRRTTGWTWMPEKFAGLHTINRLMSHGKTCVGGTYFGRTEKAKPMFAEGFHDFKEDAWIRQGPHDKLKPTRWFGFGCSLVHRNVFHDIVAKYPQLQGHWFSTSEHDVVARSKEALAVLNDSNVTPEARVQKASELVSSGLKLSEHNAKLGTGEDIIFLHRAAQAGHQPFIDCGLLCAHIGNKAYGPKRD